MEGKHYNGSYRNKLQGCEQDELAQECDEAGTSTRSVEPLASTTNDYVL